MTPCVHSLIQRAITPLVVLLLIVSAVGCFADTYANEGTVSITGTITDIQNQQTCAVYNCHIGSTWTLQMSFVAPEWSAPGSSYSISDVLLNCFGGPPCITGYHATSDFGWGPFGFDILLVDIENGQIVGARADTGGYSIEWGQANSWQYVDGFSGTTTGQSEATPEPACLITFISGAVVVAMRRLSPISRMN